MAKHKGAVEDLLEFGSDDEVGAPCPGNLMRVLSPELQEAARASRRDMVARVCDALNLEPCTYREYVMGNVRKRTRALREYRCGVCGEPSGDFGICLDCEEAT